MGPGDVLLRQDGPSEPLEAGGALQVPPVDPLHDLLFYVSRDLLLAWSFYDITGMYNGSCKKNSFINGRAIKALPPPLGLTGHRIFYWPRIFF